MCRMSRRYIPLPHRRSSVICSCASERISERGPFKSQFRMRHPLVECRKYFANVVASIMVEISGARTTRVVRAPVTLSGACRCATGRPWPLRQVCRSSSHQRPSRGAEPSRRGVGRNSRIGPWHAGTGSRWTARANRRGRPAILTADRHESSWHQLATSASEIARRLDLVAGRAAMAAYLGPNRRTQGALSLPATSYRRGRQPSWRAHQRRCAFVRGVRGGGGSIGLSGLPSTGNRLFRSLRLKPRQGRSTLARSSTR